MRINVWLMSLIAACVLAACGGGGGGGNPPPTIPPVSPTSTPTTAPTSAPTSTYVAQYPGDGGNATATVKSYNPNVTNMLECGYRATDSVLQIGLLTGCDPLNIFITTSSPAGVFGNHWITYTNKQTNTDGSTSFTFPVDQSPGGDVVMYAGVSNGVASFISFNGASTRVSSSPANMFQVLTSSTEQIGPNCSATIICPTVGSLGLTPGALMFGVFQPIEITVSLSGKILLTTHTLATDPLFGLGMSLQGLSFGGQSAPIRAIPCGNANGSPCNPVYTDVSTGTIWGTTPSGTQPWPSLTQGEIFGNVPLFSNSCRQWVYFPGGPTGTTNPSTIPFSQVRVETATGSYTQTTAGVSPPTFCLASTSLV